MQILHLDANREMRGGQWQVLRLIEGLAAAGVESTLLARRGAAVRPGARARPARGAAGPAAPLLASRRCDLVHAHDARATRWRLAAGRPLVVSRRVAFPLRSRWKYGRPRHYLAVSEFVSGVLEAAGVPPEKIDVVYDGVPLLEPARGAAILAPDNRDDPQKGAALAAKRRGWRESTCSFRPPWSATWRRPRFSSTSPTAKASVRACCWPCRRACR